MQLPVWVIVIQTMLLTATTLILAYFILSAREYLVELQALKPKTKRSKTAVRKP